MSSSDNTNLAVKASSQPPAEYFCPSEPIFIWTLSDTTTFQIAIATTCIACPVTILLNILVIVAVKKRRELGKNSNVLFASMAVADCFVGAVSMPLSITTDALLLDRIVGYPICKIAFTNQLVLYAAVCASLYHMTVIAWERYVAIRKWRDYKAIVTKSRIKKYARIAWLLAVLTTSPARILMAVGIDYKYLKILNSICTLPAVVCIVLVGYFYIMVYYGVRKKKLSDIHQSTSRAKAKMERSVARTTGILTFALLISYVPSIVVLLVGETVPFLRTSTFFRWSELLTQLNSLVNPLLYCIVLNHRFRSEVLKMLKMGNRDKIQPPYCVQQRRRARPRRVGAEEDVVEGIQEFEEGGGQRMDRLGRSDSYDLNMVERMMDESSSVSSPCEVNHTISVDVHQPKPIRLRPKIMTQAEDTSEQRNFEEETTLAKTLAPSPKRRNTTPDEIEMILSFQELQQSFKDRQAGGTSMTFISG